MNKNRVCASNTRCGAPDIACDTGAERSGPAGIVISEADWVAT